jgi:hypothetical protein
MFTEEFIKLKMVCCIPHFIQIALYNNVGLIHKHFLTLQLTDYISYYIKASAVFCTERRAKVDTDSNQKLKNPFGKFGKIRIFYIHRIINI